MSAYILKLESIAAIADYIDCLNFVGFDYFGYSIPLSLNQALSLKRSGNQRNIFNALYELNAKAVNGRYSTEEPLTAEMPKNHPIIYKPVNWDSENSCFIVEPWHYQLLKSLQCFIYQCTEDPATKEPLYKALEELEKTLVFFIAQNNPLYKKAVWG